MRNALIVAALFIAPAAAMAEGISYTYVDARYFSTDSDAVTVNQNGGKLAASFGLGSNFFVAADGRIGQSERVNVGTSSGRFDGAGASLRAGAHYAITPTLDILADAGGLYSEFTGKGAFKGNKDDGFGYIVETGLRLAVIPQFEVGALFSYQDVLDATTSFFTADLQYHATEQFSLVGSVSNAKTIDFYSIGLRYNF